MQRTKATKAIRQNSTTRRHNTQSPRSRPTAQDFHYCSYKLSVPDSQAPELFPAANCLCSYNHHSVQSNKIYSRHLVHPGPTPSSTNNSLCLTETCIDVIQHLFTIRFRNERHGFSHPHVSGQRSAGSLSHRAPTLRSRLRLHHWG